MAAETASLSSCVAPNGINTIVVPLAQLIPSPEEVGGQEQLPEDNPSVMPRKAE